jgi:hypothetical protein
MVNGKKEEVGRMRWNCQGGRRRTEARGKKWRRSGGNTEAMAMLEKEPDVEEGRTHSFCVQ